MIKQATGHSPFCALSPYRTWLPVSLPDSEDFRHFLDHEVENTAISGAEGALDWKTENLDEGGFEDPFTAEERLNIACILHRSADRSNDRRRCYFIGGDVGGIKIGFSGDVAGRLKLIQTYSPIKVSVLAVRPGGVARESAYHTEFAAHRLHGEWFAPHPDILTEIARYRPTRDWSVARRVNQGEVW